MSAGNSTTISSAVAWNMDFYVYGATPAILNG
jgi:hypothetical protein